MKKTFLVILFVLSALCSNAETIWYKSFSFAMKYVDEYGYWTSWTDWSASNVKIAIDDEEDIITIYSKTPQIYIVKKYNGSYYDDKGGKQASFNVIDQDMDNGLIRLRVERNGNSQIYVQFADIIWVYNVRRIYR